MTRLLEDLDQKKIATGDFIVRGSSGMLYLGILVCLWWWYGVFLERIRPANSLVRYFHDFLALTVFAMAAGFWSRARYFAVLVFLGASLMLVRFWPARSSSQTRSEDKTALGITSLVLAATTLGIILFSSGWMLAKHDLPEERHMAIFLIVLMGVGVVVTFYSAVITHQSPVREQEQIRGRIETYPQAGGTLHLIPTWPREFSSEQIETVIANVERAREEFEHQLRSRSEYLDPRPHRSRVHSFADVIIQACLLGVPSVDKPEEIYKKAYIAFFGHWLDDILDQNMAAKIADRTRNQESFWESFTLADLFGRRSDEAQILGLLRIAEERVQDKKMFTHGLVRLALGSVMFHPHWATDLVRNEHNNRLLRRLEWTAQQQIRENVDPLLLALTTKTVQELWFSCEPETENSWSLAILYSILFAPALYHHDIRAEVEQGEMKDIKVTDERFSQAIVTVAGLLKNYTGVRKKLRSHQVQVVRDAFSRCLPDAIKDSYKKAAESLL